MNTDARTLRSLPLEAFDHPRPGDAGVPGAREPRFGSRATAAHNSRPAMPSS